MKTSFISVLVLSLVVAFQVAAATASEIYTFRSQRAPGAVDHVAINIKVGGETKYLDHGKPQEEKVGMACDYEYDEKTLEIGAKSDDAWRSVRNYTVVNVMGDEFKPTLRPERRLICAETAGQSTLLFSPNGSLNRTELDLIDVQANTLLWDRLLPDKAVSVNDTWKYSEQFMAAMLGLDEVAKSDVESKLKEVNDKVARFEIAGKVEGAIHGVASQVELKGRYRFDLRLNRVDWLALVIKEDRQTSLVADGLSVNSVFQMTARPINEVPELSNNALRDIAPKLKASPETSLLTYDSNVGGWQFDHDRHWYIYRTQRELAVLRMLDRGETLGQCNVSSLPARNPSNLITLEDFQSDVRKALGNNFGEIVEAGEGVDNAGHRTLRVVVDGTSSDMAIRWIYYHIADSQGRQAAFTFTVEKSLLERFAESDRTLVQSLRFTESSVQANQPNKARGKLGSPANHSSNPAVEQPNLAAEKTDSDNAQENAQNAEKLESDTARR
jgi:hypothetical protein